MKNIYHISGMTCNSCKAEVEKSISHLEDVTNIVVNLEKEEAEIAMRNYIDVATLQKKLPPRFVISKTDPQNIFTSTSSTNNDKQRKNKLQQLRPLLLILIYIAVASVLLHYKSWNWKAFMLDFMGLFFIVFSFFKILDLKGFTSAFRGYDPLAKLVPIYSWIYPFIEVALGLMFLMRFKISIALILTLFVLGTTTIGVAKSLFNKKHILCACLGTVLKLPMTEATLVENIIMIVMAILLGLNLI